MFNDIRVPYNDNAGYKNVDPDDNTLTFKWHTIKLTHYAKANI